MPPTALHALFAPRSVVLVGASPTPGTLGAVVLGNLRAAGFAGPLHLVNPRHATIGADRCHASVRELPEVPEFAIVVADDWQGTGLARELLGALVAVARDRRLATLTGVTLATNTRMRKLAAGLGFDVQPDPDDGQLVRMRRAL